MSAVSGSQERNRADGSFELTEIDYTD